MGLFLLSDCDASLYCGWCPGCDRGLVKVELTAEQTAELRAVANSRDVSGPVAIRARVVLWTAEGRMRKEIGELSGLSLPTVDRWVDRYIEHGLAGLEEHKRGGGREQVPAAVRDKILELTRQPPPEETGLSHWSSREMARYVSRTERVHVNFSYVAKLWREHKLKPHQQGTFKLSRDPNFADKVFDLVGLYLSPPVGAVVLSIDEKTQVQALDRTQPLLPISFGMTEKRTHDYRRHGTTNLFAAIDIGTGTVVGDCYQTRTGADFLDFLIKATQPHAGKQIHVVVDNLSTHTTPEVKAWLGANPNVTFHFTPIGSSWLNPIETFFGTITKQAIRRGTFTSVDALIQRIRNYLEHWNSHAEPFIWTATAEEILTKVRLVEASIRKLVENNAK